MRCILGSRKTSPILSLQVETVLPPINLRFKHLLIKWFTKVESSTYLADLLGASVENKNWTFKEATSRTSSQMCLQACGVPVYNPPPIEPWINLSKNISLDLPVDASVTSFSNNIFNEYIEEHYPDYYHIYTDGSKLECGSTSSAIYVPEANYVTTYKMNPAHSILGAELYAILKAVQHIENRDPDSQLHFLILSDSQAALQCIANTTKTVYKSITQQHPIYEKLPIKRGKTHQLGGTFCRILEKNLEVCSGFIRQGKIPL